jgi:hypothetical protein
MAISDQASDQIDKGIDWTAMNEYVQSERVLELIDHTLNNGSLT